MYEQDAGKVGILLLENIFVNLSTNCLEQKIQSFFSIFKYNINFAAGGSGSNHFRFFVKHLYYKQFK